MEFLIQYGYPGLFTSSFLAATILPLSSEVVLAALVMNGLDPVLLLAVATFGNVLGALVNYIAGLTGGHFFMGKLLRLTDSEYESACRRYEKLGTAGLLLAWAPVIGDPLTFVAGTVRVNPVLFLLLVTAGKACRYLVILFLFC